MSSNKHVTSNFRDPLQPVVAESKQCVKFLILLDCGYYTVEPMCQTRGLQVRSGRPHNPIRPAKVFSFSINITSFHNVLHYSPQHAL